ncbi:hypothetical protein [Siphonobacter curvatus]|uniref:Uncharacterized protein n=1 Tax=Siphonobacter curvatus TaxID=2094562 RepID=A0A2S7IRC2_9BACT|nr:hypothetical protein [Siphonobacter curvatus]PQA60130.1 hypothetical protein C5O19_11085 [Siphonobacter curvatus]
MKKTYILLISSILTLLLITSLGVTYLPSIFGFVLFRTKQYAVFNDQHLPLDACLFDKKQTLDNESTHELILYFPSENTYNYLTIVPEHKLIGLANRTNKNLYVLPGEKLAYMCPEGSLFTPLNTLFLNQLFKHHFSKGSIEFDTFDDLKKMGKRILIKNTVL